MSQNSTTVLEEAEVSSVPSLEEQWLQIRLTDNKYALKVSFVREMISLGEMPVTPVPNLPSQIVGVINLRGSIVPLLDLRDVLGLTTMSEEIQSLLDMFDARERDHVNWINELKASVEEGHEFKLTTDPHKCAFGKWYDELMSDKVKHLAFTQGDIVMEHLLRELDQPHQTIHGIAERVADLGSEGKQEQALSLIENVKDTHLKSMVEIFAKMKEVVPRQRKQLAIVVEVDEQLIGLRVDAVDVVLNLKQDDIQPVESLGAISSAVIGACRPDDSETVLILDISTIVDLSGLPRL